MAAPAKTFTIRPLNEINISEEDELKSRQERFRRHFNEGVVADVDGAGASTSGTAIPAIQRTSTLLNSFPRLKETATHAAVLKDLKEIKPLPPETLKESGSASIGHEKLSNDESSKKSYQIVSVPKPSASSSLVISHRQRGNPLISFLRNVRLEYVEMIPDYVLGRTTCAIFLSIRYHALHPDYIHERLRLLGKSYDLRILLVHIDAKDPHHQLKDLTKIAILADCTLLLAWSAEEAARHLETYKIYENKPPEVLMKKQETDSYSRIIDALSSIRTINKSDAASLITAFGSFENIAKASMEDLEACPGMGPKKAKNLHSVLHKTFLK